MNLTNVEFIILQIIYERKGVSGYEISRLVKERGYMEWANIGISSIYVGLNKLSKRKLLHSFIDTEKQGKGPMPKKFKITQEGKKLLRQEILLALSSSRERDCRFDLAFTAIPLVAPKEVVAALKKRKNFLEETAERVSTIFESQGGEELPFHLQALFNHPLLFIKQEMDFIDSLLQKL